MRGNREPGGGGSASLRREQKQATREALIDAGLRLVAQHGLDVSLDAICAAAGFTRGAFYVHFADRDDFLVAVMDRVGSRFLDAVLGGGDLVSTVRRFVRAVAEGRYPLMGDAGVKPHQLLDACARSPRIRARYVGLVRDSLGRLGDAVRAGQRGGALRRDLDVDAVAMILLATVVGIQTLAELEVPIEAERVAASVLALLTG